MNADDKILPDTIRTAVRKLKVKEVTPPVPIQFDQGEGKPKITVYWLLRLNNRTAQTTIPFEEVKTQVERLALLMKVGGITAADERITAFHDSSDIKVSLPGYDNLLKKSK